MKNQLSSAWDRARKNQTPGAARKSATQKNRLECPAGPFYHRNQFLARFDRAAAVFAASRALLNTS